MGCLEAILVPSVFFLFRIVIKEMVVQRVLKSICIITNMARLPDKRL